MNAPLVPEPSSLEITEISPFGASELSSFSEEGFSVVSSTASLFVVSSLPLSFPHAVKPNTIVPIKIAANIFFFIINTLL